MKQALLAAAAIFIASPASAQSELEAGMTGALRGCEEWVVNPASWSKGTGPFIATVGLGSKMGSVARVEEINLPPPELRRGNHYWRINSTPRAGYILVVSDQLPMCHITGGGDEDLQPVIEAVLRSADFMARWVRVQELPQGEMLSSRFQNRADPGFFIQISRAAKPKQRLDRVQVMGTATYE